MDKESKIDEWYLKQVKQTKDRELRQIEEENDEFNNSPEGKRSRSQNQSMVSINESEFKTAKNHEDEFTEGDIGGSNTQINNEERKEGSSNFPNMTP